MQSRRESFYEATHNTWMGLILSLMIQQFVIAPAAAATQGCHLSVAFNIGATAIFTIVSVARNYTIRRYNVFKARHGIRNMRGALAFFLDRKGTL